MRGKSKIIFLALLVLALSACQPALIEPTPTPTPEIVPSPTITSTPTPIPTSTAIPTATFPPTPTEIINTRVSVNDLPPGLYYVTGDMMSGRLEIHQIDGDFSGLLLAGGFIGLGFPNPQFTKMLQFDLSNLNVFDWQTNQITSYNFPKNEKIQPGYWNDYAWSPDGEKIIATYDLLDSNQDQLGFIYLFDTTIQIIDLGLAVIEYSAWSPNGEMIAFQASTAPDHDAPTSIYLMDANCLDDVTTCKDRTQLVFTKSGYSYSTPIWSADSQYLAFNCTNLTTDETGLCLGNITSGNLSTISPPEEYTYDAVWSPIGLELAYSCKNKPAEEYAYGLCIKNITTGEINIIANSPTPYSGLAWSPDGNWIKISTGGESTSLITPDGSDIKFTGLFLYWVYIPEN